MGKRKFIISDIKAGILRVFKDGMSAKELRIAYNHDEEVRDRNGELDMPMIYEAIEWMELKIK